MTSLELSFIVILVLALAVMFLLLVVRILGPLELPDSRPIPRHRTRVRPRFRELYEERAENPDEQFAER